MYYKKLNKLVTNEKIPKRELAKQIYKDMKLFKCIDVVKEVSALSYIPEDEIQKEIDKLVRKEKIDKINENQNRR